MIMASIDPYEFVFPQHLVKEVLPRPGGVEVPQPPFARDAADQWWARLDTVRDRVNELLAAERTDPGIAAAARDESSPAWAAMALHVGSDENGSSKSSWGEAAKTWADPAVSAIGPVAAAQVAVWWAATGVLVENLEARDGAWEVESTYVTKRVSAYITSLVVPTVPPVPAGYYRRRDHHDSRVVGFVRADQGFFLSPHDVRLRLRLAASKWDGAEALEPLGALGGGARLVMSVLVPQRRDWYAAAGPVRSTDLLVSAATSDEVMAFANLSQRGQWGWSVHPAWPTVLDAVGVEAAELAEAALAAGSLDRSTVPVDVLAAIPTQAAFRVLLEAADGNRDAAAAAVQHALRWPRVAAPVLAASAATNPRSRTLLGMLSLDDLTAYRDELTDEAWSTIEAHAKAPAGPVADLSAVPGLLVVLPWDDRPAVGVLKLKNPSTETEVHWRPGEREAWSTWPGSTVPLSEAELSDLLGETRVHPSVLSRFLAQAPLDATSPIIDRLDYTTRAAGLMEGPILARQEDPALAAKLALAWATRWWRPSRWAVQPFVNQAIVSKVIEWLSRKKKDVRDDALAYLQHQAGPVSRYLLPVAFGRPGKAQHAALSALLLLQQSGYGQAVAEVAATYGTAAAEAWHQVAEAGPLVVGLPAAAPALPGWLAVGALPPVQLASGAGALPVTAVENLVTMLAISTLETPYAGLDLVRESCTPGSLAVLVRGLFEQWQVAAYPSSEGWVLDALGVFGDDEAARRLAPLLRVWPGESAHQRAVKGLDVLLAIGSDVALMQLHSISQKVKFKGIKDQARARIDALAEQLGLTSAQLADRLVPDLGLAADGTMVLDFGDKTFTVGFDEQLRPTVTDEAGKIRKSLPRTTTEPGASSAKTFAALKKDVRAVADLQLRRLEEAMVTQREWTLEEFTTYLVDHPLVWHLTRRLVWGCDNGFFRVAEDKTFADVDDEAFAPVGTVRVAHQLNLGDQAPGWAALLADYEILQPFPQIGRDTYTADQVAGLDGLAVSSGKVLGLERRGWRRAPAVDNGSQWSIDRPLPDGSLWEMRLNPGFVVDMPMMNEEQIIHPATLAGLDPITCSEILRDLHTLRG